MPDRVLNAGNPIRASPEWWTASSRVCVRRSGLGRQLERDSRVYIIGGASSKMAQEGCGQRVSLRWRNISESVDVNNSQFTLV